MGQILLTIDQPFSPLTRVIITWVNGLILLFVVAPLAIFTRSPGRRAAYRSWTLASLALFPLGLVRFVPETQTQAAAAAQIGVSLSLVAILALLARRRGHGAELSWPVTVAAIAIVPILLLPWLALGALGSPLDSLLNLLAGLSLGMLAGLLLDGFLVAPLVAHSRGIGRDTAFGGLSTVVALAILAAGFGFGGSQLLLLGAIPLLGFAAMAFALYVATPERPYGHAWLPLAALLGLVAAAPLLFFDPDELTLLLGMDDIPGWAARATAISALLALLVSLVMIIIRLRWATLPPPRMLTALAAPGWVAALLVYFLVGQPGFYGEQLFVILRDQPDLTQAYSIADRDQRTRYVYETLVNNAEASQSRVRGVLDRFGIGYRPYYLVNALEVDAGPIARLYLSLQPEVDRVLDSPRLRPLPEPPSASTGSESPPTGPAWSVAAIGADRVWSELGVTGAGIVVGQSDSGVQGSHPDLQGGYRGQSNQNDYHWLDPWNGTTSPTDINGHGTFTLGSAVGRNGIGVAPGAQWIGCVNLARNLGNPARYLDCMQFMLA
ncbi:MAG: S8 family serine peptidase, partial [Chloroflexota bacterium]